MKTLKSYLTPTIILVVVAGLFIHGAFIYEATPPDLDCPEGERIATMAEFRPQHDKVLYFFPWFETWECTAEVGKMPLYWRGLY